MAKRASNPSKSSASAGDAPSGGPRLPGVVVIAGPDLYRQHRALVQVRERLRAAHGTVDLILFDGASASAAEILDECRSFGLIATHKLVVVDPADKLLSAPKDDDEDGEPAGMAAGGGGGGGGARPLFEKYQSAPTDSTTLVLRFKKYQNSKIDKAAEAAGGLFKCAELKEEELGAFLAERCVAHRVKLDRHSAAALLDRVGTDAARLDAEIAKLGAIAAGLEADPAKAGEVSVTEELVSEFVGRSREESVWNLQSVVMYSGPAAAVGYVRSLLEVSREPTVLVSYALVDLARKLHTLSLGTRAGVAPQALAKMLKLWGPSADGMLAAGRALEPKAAARMLKNALEADQRQKTGLSEGPRALEILALRMATMLSKFAKPATSGGGGGWGGGWGGFGARGQHVETMRR
ncbi:MAG: DNA polymerase III subunit delta, partial [Planctomycetota bacterium]|nr:DNA polymerase III subunit delta [Planctomycetota bacterium]